MTLDEMDEHAVWEQHVTLCDLFGSEVQLEVVVGECVDCDGSGELAVGNDDDVW